MRLASIQVRDVRSILAADLDPGPIMNLLIGPNGSGKTSLLEAIHFLSLGRSFRTRRARAVIRRGSETLTVFGRVQDEEGSENCAIGIEKGVNHTRFRVDGEEVRSVSRLARRLPVMVISPEGLKALLEGSEHRRRILDWTLFHVEQGYLQVLQRYDHVLRQRNAYYEHPGAGKSIESSAYGITNWRHMANSLMRCVDVTSNLLEWQTSPTRWPSPC